MNNPKEIQYPTTLDAKVDALGTLISSLSKEVLAHSSDDGPGKKLFDLTMRWSSQLETPLELVWRLTMQPHATSALMTVIKMGIVEIVAKEGKPLSAEELSKRVGAEKVLVVRMIRPLIQMGVFKEVDVELYGATGVTKILTDPIVLGNFYYMYTCPGRSLYQLGDYLASKNYTNPNAAPSCFQYARNTDKEHFPWLMQHPDLMSHFNRHMAGQHALRMDWFAELDVNRMMLDGAKNDANSVLMVDIGGGEGHDIENFGKAHPKAPGRLVLQDLPEAIDNIKQLDPWVERQKHDFFTPQPVKGARVYYMRSILYDWPDDKCFDILSHLRGSMEKGYSRLFLNEFVLPMKNVPLYPALLDINMMCLLNAMERTEGQWRELLGKAGFKVIQFNVDPSGEKEGLIEAEVG